MAFLSSMKLPLMPVISLNSSRNPKPTHCTSLQLQAITADAGIECEPCEGRGWLLCDFCKGQKTNVKSETNRIYRRCPSCRAVGYVLCPKCKVFKCVTFPDQSDVESSR
ncbi:putative Heat shock protein DnaJ, cysteine-rich domain superfamily [Helianthus annuus]|uniref:Heat shock protein DnaJ, cysteine-rich domain superfamily n=1 Tax=Helianthus annuus TaxID=4232 RepID=A0A251RM34_HELAN|nr:uncharacterized protein LOC110922988 [Helianthus annuus]KAF5754007.1 putative Heat shock protein DnaJ, cysteine-rich domain superfamily [Helianthus annuus]KAJ0427985.1 putative Heat shock protein DnaJ, cysteine-rich domain superfamily [Helianthus annuus]KAJ0446293.1 putative Heat shock protein DnaJ, cysteine-rich domain superfamily [Helianthus annuus]KAJ0631246.1 putative Heat shock protein DnaJ, cysteine-rich domain superfamily [Helianthus annuus]KAJ0635127.1 putative Heat shock protein Dn